MIGFPQRTAPSLLTVLFSLMLLILVVAAPLIAAAQPEQDDVAAAATGVEFQPRLGDFHYDIHWGIKRVASGVISVSRDSDHYVLTLHKKTTDAIDLVYRVRYRGETRIKAEDLSPDHSILSEEVKKKKKIQDARYDPATGSVSVVETRSKLKTSGGDKVKEFDLESDIGIFDAFTAIFLARSFDWQLGESHQFSVFIGQKEYDVSLDCIEKMKMDLPIGNIPVWVIRPTVVKRDDGKESSGGENTLMYLSADESKDIIKIKTKLGIGSVELRLVKYVE
ncbi:hypothetical protein DSLASN_19810 [Desulfoluna limicola]|uniref:DUF3108 domain-containing protein n=2 Tax=Desulfoluna limicola TaxID=2810562 RepID=A0ABN6F1E7_9BACT|nr:hypothetical protein DSLASN_19810 [Desulfoluna limicola]